ncbi:MAG TPA: translation initiation factor 1A, partial [Methanocorpusculum sp.]|nr:translation initiation factor 1A [Methanocorpusculum sp.]
MGRIENANQTVSDDGSIVRVKLPNKRIREQFAQAELMLGSNHIRVRCSDGVT